MNQRPYDKTLPLEELANLRGLIKFASPMPWRWATSNSMARLSSASGKDGDVIHAFKAVDEVPCVNVSLDNMNLIACAVKTHQVTLRPRTVSTTFARRWKRKQKCCASTAGVRAMTNEERLSLVERCKTIAAWREKYGDNANVMLPALEAKQIAEIALASLQAESFAFIHPQMLEDLKYKARSCGRCWTGSHDELSGEARIPVYTTAPAMPDGFDPDSGHETTVVAHYHAHGEWIKCKSHIEEICDYVLLPELKNVGGL